jgi:hypothetical protein
VLRESSSYVIARNESWRGDCASEPVEAGWATEAVFFLRALEDARGAMPEAFVEISPDGMRWVPEGARALLPSTANGVCALRVVRFGNWLRVRAIMPEGSECVVLVTLHLK